MREAGREDGSSGVHPSLRRADSKSCRALAGLLTSSCALQSVPSQHHDEQRSRHKPHDHGRRISARPARALTKLKLPRRLVPKRLDQLAGDVQEARLARGLEPLRQGDHQQRDRPRRGLAGAAHGVARRAANALHRLRVGGKAVCRGGGGGKVGKVQKSRSCMRAAPAPGAGSAAACWDAGGRSMRLMAQAGYAAAAGVNRQAA